MVVVHHHMEAGDMAAVTEVAATGIHLDLVGSLPGGKCHHRTLDDSSRVFWRRPYLHDAVLAPGLSAPS